MTILSQDLQLLESAVMDDNNDGGGGRTDRVIVDGQSNNIFGDIATLDRVYGNVSLRKVFAGVRTQTIDQLLGSHVILSKLPKDKKIGVNLFSTGDHHDQRPDATYRIENYRGQGAKYIGFLYGKQYQGSQVLTVFQPEKSEISSSGDVLLLVITATNVQQYVRITNVTSVVQEFTDSQGAYKRKILNIEISSPLQHDFQGVDVSRFDNVSSPSAIYKTTVANAARYYSARPLKNAAELGDYSVTVDSIYSQVVPSSQTETPLVDLNAAGNVSPLISGSDDSISMTFGHNIAASVGVYLGSPIYPATLSISTGGGAITDDGGELKLGGVSIGTINYTQGLLSFGASAPTIYGTKTASFKPAGVPLMIADTDSIPVTDASRAFVYVLNINPPPKPNALSVSYRALDNWYTLNDNGTGGLVSADNSGSGTINYASGSVAITLAALPDVGSEIIFTWGKSVDYQSRAGSTLQAAISKQLAHQHINAATLTIQWNDGQARTLTSNSAGVLSGNGSGSVDSLNGIVTFYPNPLPPKDTEFSINYSHVSGDSSNFVTKTLANFNMVGGSVELNTLDSNLVPGSIVVEWSIPWGSHTPEIVLSGDYVQLPIPANGILQQSDRDNGSGSFIGGRSAVIDYANGIIAFTWQKDIALKFPLFSNIKSTAGVNSLFRGYLGGLADLSPPTQFIVHYRLGGSNSATVTETVTLTDTSLTIENGGENLIAGSVLFDFAGKRYVDRLGQLYHSINPENGAGTYGGTINYSTGQCNLISWTGNGTNSGAVLSALSSANYTPVDRVAFRTPQAPIKPSSFSVRATQLDGTLINATSNDGGVLSTTNLKGAIDQNTGIVKIDFGQWVTAAGHENEPWYNPAMIENGMIFMPKPVFADTVIYNAVSYTFLPLSADILGLDPVRLPIDGRIPVFRKGDVVVILNNQTTIGTFTSSTTTNLGRTRIAKITVKDLGGNLLPANKWTADLDTGVITWGDLSGISQPLTIIDRIEDMAVLSDVQITGKLTLSTPVTHNYDTDTLVSNAVVFGDVYARASTPFDQQTWTNVWSDMVVGNTVPAQYNATDYPIEVTNLSTIEERWLIQFVTSSVFNVVGEHSGQIVSGASINSDLAPINPHTNDPYFILRAAGWGGGWSAGNILRFNTYQAHKPIWIVQSVGQGEATDTDYGFCLEFRGDVDAP